MRENSSFAIRTSKFEIRFSWNAPCRISALMKPALVAATIILAAACGTPPRESHVPQAGSHSEMKTIDSSDVRPAVMDPPPMLTEEAPPPKPKENVAQADAPPPPTPQ